MDASIKKYESIKTGYAEKTKGPLHQK
jgi:hypothetical protein